jgi:excisionase family DNA binding protein
LVIEIDESSVTSRNDARQLPSVDTDREGNDEPTVVRRPLLVTIPEAAQMLAVGRSTIYQLIWTEQLTPIHIGRSVRLAVEQLEHFVNGRLATDGQLGPT